VDSGAHTPHIDEETATVAVPSGHLVLDRGRATIEVVHSERDPVVAEIVHPFLWPAAAVFARWRGLETLHAGAFALPGHSGAWVVMGESGGGKSSLLAALFLAGCEVLVDDLVVLEGRDCFAGPRCVDLKLDAARSMGVEDRTTVVRASQRRRLTLPPVRGRRRVAGFVVLRWDEPIAVTRLSPSAGFATLAVHRRVGALGADHSHLLELAGLPMLALRRPREWGTAGEVVSELIAAIGGCSL
jgi:hypothetical protein